VKKRIRELIEGKLTNQDGVSLATWPAVERKDPQPTFLIEASYLEARVKEILERLPRHKELFTPQEVAFAVSRSDRWVRNRFGLNPRCFDAGNASKVYLSIPRVVVAEEIRKMYRCPMLRAAVAA
jgi:hypothetical protein